MWGNFTKSRTIASGTMKPATPANPKPGAPKRSACGMGPTTSQLRATNARIELVAKI